jgi:Xaa-Pro aminopeptidase
LPKRTIRIARVLTLLAVVFVSTTAAVFGDERSADLAARRRRAMERLGPDAMLVMTSAPARVYSLDVSYEYRQDSNLYYLTGIAQADTSLILMPGNAERTEILFVRDADPAQEHWRGRLLTHDQAHERSGIRTVLSSAQFEPFLAAVLSRQSFGSGFDDRELARFFTALADGRARVALPLDAAGSRDPLTPAQELSLRLRDRYAGFQAIDATPILTDLRLIKTPYEQQLLVTASAISADAQIAGMRITRPGVFEYEVKAAIEAVHRGRGAVSWAYPSITGSGPNATILHYPEGDRKMVAGDLLLVDAACNYEYMSPDITRTYPVTGRFTQAQKDIYTIVLTAQDEGLKAANAGRSIAAVHDAVVASLKTALLKLGLITDTTGDQYRMWFTHGATHYIGIDVHDVGARTRTLEPGMAFVIEPGVYIRQAALDALPKTAANLALIEQIQAAVTKYLDIGVRIEDSFLLESSGPRRLTGSVPRTIAAIEHFMQTRSR